MSARDGLTPGQRLAAQAAEAAEIRTWQTHPDVVALQVERTRTLVDRLMWGGILVGLAFTMVNVQQFAARTTGATPGTLGWWAAWLLDPRSRRSCWGSSLLSAGSRRARSGWTASRGPRSGSCSRPRT